MTIQYDAYGQPYNENVSATSSVGLINPESISLQVDNTQVVREVEMLFKGFGYDEKEKPVPVTEPMMNAAGIQRLIMTMRVHTDKNNRLTNYTDEEIYHTMLPFSKGINQFLSVNHRKLGIDKSNLSLIKYNIVNPTFSNYKASAGAKQMDNIAQQTKIMQNNTMAAQKKGFFRRMMPF